jgi:HAD superfamily hydrolase (TIGR01509 family)
MIRAILFDFNGVIADDETPHVLCFQQALAEEGLLLTKDEYYGVYLGMDERTCAKILITARDGICDDRLLQRIMNRKAELFHTNTTAHKPTLFPGVVEFVKAAKPTYRLAIVSGGRREQIDAALTGTLIKQDFELIISAEDCPIGKPDPAIYRLTCERLNAVGAISCAITPADCLVIEDSLADIRSAKAAGMRVLALATTYPIDKLGEADAVLSSLHDITPDRAISMAVQIGTECQLPATQPQ